MEIKSYEPIDAFTSLSSIESLKTPQFDTNHGDRTSNKAAWFLSESHRDRTAACKGLPLPRQTSINSEVSGISSSASKYEVDVFSKTHPTPRGEKGSAKFNRSVSEELPRPWKVKQNNWFTPNFESPEGKSAQHNSTKKVDSDSKDRRQRKKSSIALFAEKVMDTLKELTDIPDSPCYDQTNVEAFVCDW